MTDLFKKLAELADQLDQIEAVAEADEIDELLQAIAPLAIEEEKLPGICEVCGGSGAGIDAPWCEACKGSGKGNLILEASIDKFSYIRHEDGKWNVYSKKGKRMGSYPSKKKAQERLRQIEFFKRQ